MAIYFFCYPHGPAERAGYEHEIVCLAEGLRSLGIPFSGSVDYWREGNAPNDFLIRRKPGSSHRDADVVVFSSVMYDYDAVSRLLPQDLFDPKRRYRLVFIDASDGLRTPGFRPEMRACDFVLKCHYNRKYAAPANFLPWAFGISMRILGQLTADSARDHTSHRVPEILVNYRVEHSVRERAKTRVLPLFEGILEEHHAIDSPGVEDLDDQDRLLWVQTGRRHYPTYYRRLLASAACSCFGGQLATMADDRSGVCWHLLRHLDRRLHFLPEDRVYQFDSWRRWESFAAGTCVLDIDLEKYGCVLPVMPVNLQHYLGFDLEQPQRVTDQIRSDVDLIARVAEAGRAWALEHYTPVAVARRLLDFTK